MIAGGSVPSYYPSFGRNSLNDVRVDFADALIAEQNLEMGCSHTVPFDRCAARPIPSMELLA